MLGGHIQSRDHRAFGAQSVAERVTDDLPAEQLQNDRQILPAALGPDVGDVAGPYLVGRFGAEILLEQIGRDRLLMIRIGRDLELPSGFGANEPLPNRRTAILGS